MKTNILARFAIALSTIVPLIMGDSVPWERLDKDKAILVIVDMQEGLFSLTRDFDPTIFYNNMMAHAAIGQAFDLPVIMTTSAETGPNGRLPQEMTDMYPDAPLIQRAGEIDAWDSAEFRAAVEASGRTQVIIGGIVTDVCTAFLALSLRAAGYSVWANVEASGTTSALTRDAANARMRQAGVQVVSFFAIVGDLMRDWRGTPGAQELIPFFDKYLPVSAMVSRAHKAAVLDGALLPGQDALPG